MTTLCRVDCYHYAEFMKTLHPQKAVEIHRHTCESMGLLDSCLALGNMHYAGQGYCSIRLRLYVCVYMP